MEAIFEEKTDVANAMITFGGSFIRNIGQALLCADQENVKRIHQAFTEYWVEYAQVARTIVKEK